MTELNRAASSWLGRFVSVVAGWPWVTIAVVFAAAIYCGRYMVGHIGINTDTANMISAELPWRQDFIAYRESFPARDRNLLIVIEAESHLEVDRFASELADRLEEEPAQFETVFLEGHGEFFEREGLLYLSVAELDALSDRMTEAQPLLGRIRQRFNGAAVLDFVAEAHRETDGDRLDALDGLHDQLAATLTSSLSGEARPVDWQAVMLPEVGSDTRRLVLVRPELDFARMQPARPAIDRIRAIADELNDGRQEPVAIALTGTVAMEHEELVSVTQGARAAGLAALAMVTLVLLWALRSIVLILTAVVTLVVGLVFTAAFAAFAVGDLNLLSVAFAVLYVGLGVDFILHLMLRWRELGKDDRDPERDLTETSEGVGKSLLICAVTTAAGFFAFIPTDFDGVAELGLISGVGMFISLAVSLTLLPALLAVVGRWVQRRPKTVPGLPAVGRRGIPPKVVASLGLALAVVALILVPSLEFDSNPIHLRDPDSESVRALDRLADDGEAPLFNLIALVQDEQQVAATVRDLAGLPSVDRVVTAERLVPDDQDEKLFLLEDLSLVLGPDFHRINDAPFDAAELDAAMVELAEALAGQDRRSAVALAAALNSWLERDGASADLSALDRALRSDLPERLADFERLLGASPITLEDLPAALRERWINDDGQQLIEIAPRENLNDNEAAARFVTEVRDVLPSATGLPVVYQEASSTIVRAFLQALSLALAMVAVLLVLFMRSIRDVLLVLIPILFAAAVTAGLAVLFGLPFNFANIIALPLLIGVGVDNGIHMVHRMQTEPPPDAEPLHTSTSRAVLASGLTTIASFGNLAFSAHYGMSSMGQLLTIGMLVTLVATLVLLPALIKLRAA